MMTTVTHYIVVVQNLGCSEEFDHFNTVFIGICERWTASIFFPITNPTRGTRALPGNFGEAQDPRNTSVTLASHWKSFVVRSSLLLIHYVKQFTHCLDKFIASRLFRLVISPCKTSLRYPIPEMIDER